jgi:hypothetical protein
MLMLVCFNMQSAHGATIPRQRPPSRHPRIFWGEYWRVHRNQETSPLFCYPLNVMTNDDGHDDQKNRMQITFRVKWRASCLIVRQVCTRTGLHEWLAQDGCHQWQLILMPHCQPPSRTVKSHKSVKSTILLQSSDLSFVNPISAVE